MDKEKNDTYDPIRAKRIMEFMQKENLTQERLGKLLGIKQQGIHDRLKQGRITDKFIDMLVESFPAYKRSWFEGKDDYASSLDHLQQMLQNASDEQEKMINAIKFLAALDDFHVENSKPAKTGLDGYFESRYFSFIRDGKEEFIMPESKLLALGNILYDCYYSFMKHGSDIVTRDGKKIYYTPKSVTDSVRIDNLQDEILNYNKTKKNIQSLQESNIMNDFEY